MAKMNDEHQASIFVYYFEATLKHGGNGFIYLKILPSPPKIQWWLKPVMTIFYFLFPK